MDGPLPKGHWTAAVGHRPFKQLTPGHRYQVAKAFADYDGQTHPVGEIWQFLSHNFVPYYDGLSLFVSLDDEHEWQIRLEWLPDGQGAVIDNLETYVVPVPPVR